MGFLFKKQQGPRSVPDLTGLQISTSVNVLPVAILYGSPRVPMNLIETENFEGITTPTGGGGGGGGKGLLSGGKGGSGTTTTEYFADLWMAIGEGEISSVIFVYLNQAGYEFADIPGNKPMTLVAGSAGQTAISGTNLAYRRTAGFWCPHFQLDTTGTVPQINAVVKGPYAGTCPLGNDPVGGFEDADPASCIVDLLTNQFYGVLFPVTLIAANIYSSADATDPLIGDNHYQTYCQAVGFGFSVVLNNAEPASSILERWLKLTHSAPVWNGVTLQIIPYGDMPVSLNPGWGASNPYGIAIKYYVPEHDPLFEFTDCEILQTNDNSDPVTIDRKPQEDAYNVVRLDYRERGLAYNDVPLEASIDNAVELYGKRVETMSGANEFTSSVFASNAAQLIVQRSVYIRNIYTWRLTWEWAFLDPMDLVTVTDPVLGTQILVRIISIEEDDKEELTFVAEQVLCSVDS